jgi:hypothetical protein
MKRMLFSFLLSILLFHVLYPHDVWAQAPTPSPIANPIMLDNIGALISRASIVTTPLAVVGMIFSLIYGGFVKMTALGNAEREQKSKAIWGAAFIGFLMIAFAPVIIRIITSILGVNTDLT